MTTNGNYIMRDQVENPIRSIMAYRVTQTPRKAGRISYLLSVATVTLVYLLAMTLSLD